MKAKTKSTAFSAIFVLCVGGCANEPPKPTFCESNSDCEEGYYCDPETGECEQDCKTDDDCGSGWECDDHGQCVEGDDTDTGFDTDPCGDALLFVVDRSRSMSENGKWLGLVEALGDALSSVGDLSAGLEVFPDDSCASSYTGQDMNTLCRGPDNVLVDIGPGTAQSIHDTLNYVGTCGGTPMAGALRKALVEIQEHGTEVQVVLITDGLPNCNGDIGIEDCTCLVTEPPNACENWPENCLDDVETIAAAASLLEEAGAPVHVLGYAFEPGEFTTLDDIAQAGGTTQAVACEDAATLTDAVIAIMDSVTNC